MKISEIEAAYDTDGGLKISQSFGKILAWCGSDQLLALAHAVIAQADALPDLGQFTPQEVEFLEAARNVLKAYSVKVRP